MGSRRRARESALQILFGLDWVNVDLQAAMNEYWNKFAGERPASYEDVRRHCAELVEGVAQHRTMLDQRLQAASHHWKLDRMSAVDRNILRLGALELLVLGDRVPRKVAINEAVEIAKKFGNEDSSAFVNGILDRVANALGGEKPGNGDKAKRSAKPAKDSDGPGKDSDSGAKDSDGPGKDSDGPSGGAEP